MNFIEYLFSESKKSSSFTIRKCKSTIMDIIVWQNRLKHRKQKKNVHCKSIVHTQPLFIFCYSTDKNGKGKFKAILKILTHILSIIVIGRHRITNSRTEWKLMISTLQKELFETRGKTSKVTSYESKRLKFTQDLVAE